MFAMKTLSFSGFLNLTHMNLTHIPPGMRFNGDILDLSHNQIAIIRTNSFISMTNLRILRLKNNRIDTVEDGAFRGLLHLEALHLSGNQLGGIPNISYIPNLKEFDVAENPISVVKEEDLEMTKYLDIFMLSWTRVGHIPSFPVPQKLTALHLKGNDIKQLLLDFFKNLPELLKLFVGYNKLSSFPEFGNCKKTLVVLEMTNNRLYRIPDLSDYKSLEFLDLTDKFISSVSEGPLLMTANSTVILNGNPIPSDNELCWLADHGLLITVNLSCPDGTPWESMNRDALCEGLYMDSFPSLHKMILTSSYLFVHFHPHLHTFPLTISRCFIHFSGCCTFYCYSFYFL